MTANDVGACSSFVGRFVGKAKNCQVNAHSRNEDPQAFTWGFVRAGEETRTLDLLHGKQSL